MTDSERAQAWMCTLIGCCLILGIAAGIVANDLARGVAFSFCVLGHLPEDCRGVQP